MSDFLHQISPISLITDNARNWAQELSELSFHSYFSQIWEKMTFSFMNRVVSFKKKIAAAANDLIA